MLPVFAQVEWPSAIVAIVLLLIIASIMIIAMFRYDLDGVLKLWAAIGTLFGLVIGSMATYFFTNQTHQAVTAQLQAEKQTLVAQHQAAVAEKERFALVASSAVEKSKKDQELVQNVIAEAQRESSPAAQAKEKAAPSARDAASPR